MFYLVKTPGWLRRFYGNCTWSMPAEKKKLYFSFDDGPHPVITPFVLDELKKYNAKASFFCIGKNVKAYPEVYRRIIEEGHSVGNHSFNHLNGWKHADDKYLEDIAAAKEYIDSNLFRPPYGRIRKSQLREIAKEKLALNTIMWTVLSGDFDQNITPAKCLENVLNNSKAGSIVVFHDSEKADSRMRYALRGALEYFAGKGFEFDRIVK